MSNSTIKSINPATGKIEKVFDEMTDQQIEDIISKADHAYQSWKKTSFEERAKLLKKAATLILERKEELAKLITIEMGRVIAQSYPEVELAANILNYYADHGAEFLADHVFKVESGQAFISYEPIGVILSIQPWNFPYYQILRTAAPNIMAGNTYILKHASNVPQCAVAMEKIFRDAGFPQGVYTNIFIRGSKVDKLIDDRRIKAATLTGSEPAGSAMAAAAGKNLKKTTLELGGSDPYIVLDDADIDKAVKGAVIGRFSNSGQICISTKRVIVMESVAEEFLSKLKSAVSALKVGDPLDPQIDMGPLCSESALEKVLEQVDQSVKQGAKIIMGGHRLKREGAFMEPTILTNIKPGNLAYSQEIFGPVLLYFVVKTEQEAIRLANDTDFGLGGTVVSENIDRAIGLARQVDSGTVCINRPPNITLTIDLPFGGTKNSGYGRDHYIAGIREFVNEKLIRVGDL